MTDPEVRFHQEWLGLIQPSEGLVVSIPVLVEAQCMARLAPAVQQGSSSPPGPAKAAPSWWPRLGLFLLNAQRAEEEKRTLGAKPEKKAAKGRGRKPKDSGQSSFLD